MTQFEYFNRVRMLAQEININLQELAILRETAINDQFGGIGNGDDGNGNNGGGTPRSKVETAALKIVAFESLIAEKMRTLEMIKSEVAAVIEKISDPIDRIIMMRRYVLCRSWEEIIDVTGYSRSQVFRHHRKALKYAQI